MNDVEQVIGSSILSISEINKSPVHIQHNLPEKQLFIREATKQDALLSDKATSYLDFDDRK